MNKLSKNLFIKIYAIINITIQLIITMLSFKYNFTDSLHILMVMIQYKLYQFKINFIIYLTNLYLNIRIISVVSIIFIIINITIINIIYYISAINCLCS